MKTLRTIGLGITLTASFNVYANAQCDIDTQESLLQAVDEIIYHVDARGSRLKSDSTTKQNLWDFIATNAQCITNQDMYEVGRHLSKLYKDHRYAQLMPQAAVSSYMNSNDNKNDHIEAVRPCHSLRFIGGIYNARPQYAEGCIRKYVEQNHESINIHEAYSITYPNSGGNNFYYQPIMKTLRANFDLRKPGRSSVLCRNLRSEYEFSVNSYAGRVGCVKAFFDLATDNGRFELWRKEDTIQKMCSAFKAHEHNTQEQNDLEELNKEQCIEHYTRALK